MNNDNNITSMNIYQWLIEATFAPLVLAATYLDNIEDRYVGHYRMAVAIKIPTFIMMRYAETNTSSFLNDIIASVFRITC